MTIAVRRRACMSALAFLVCGFAAASPAAIAVHTVRTDLKPLIRAASESPVQFAVLVPHAVSSASGGQWSSADGVATWRYAVSVPTAVSLSFHATQISFPQSATLVVRGTKTTVSYRASDLHRGELWSRIQPGAALEFALTVAAADRARVRFEVVSLQAGYRSLGSGVEDHPYYRQLKQQAAGSSNTDCIVNYECKVASANTPPAAATLALVVQNQYQCTGTLINDVPGDNAPYVLTARHCITGKVGVADDPSAAEATSVYWDATSSCGTALGSIYDASVPTQTGAQTMVEQQDAWLIRLDVNPVVSDAQFVGFDASGAAVQGGYTVHHAEGRDKQYVAWFGQAASVNKFAGFSNFLETVNQTGNIGPGASGGGLFDQNNRLVGTLTYGRETSDPSGYGVCPVTPPPAPNGSNGVTDFTALAAVWDTTIDHTSSTHAVTIKSILDPHNTGTLVTSSAPAVVIALRASTQGQTDGAPLQLGWSATNASQCTAGGGVPGDGWSGTLSPVNSQSLTESAPGSVTYTLTCSYPGARTATASTTVIWSGPAPQANLTASAPALWTTRPEVLTWSANVTPCSLFGGGLALTGLPASGTSTTTQANSADVTYTLSCGPASDPVDVATLVQYVTPSLTLQANLTDVLLGQTFFLGWQSYADLCTPSGGAPNDGWSTNSFTAGQESFAPQVTATGTYTYTLTCTSGPLTQQQSATVTFENNPPYVTAALDRPSVVFSGSPADYVNLTLNSNLADCTLPDIAGLNLSFSDTLPTVIGLPNVLTVQPLHSGSYTLTFTCVGSLGDSPTATSTPLTLTVLPPAPPVLAITFNPTTLLSGQTFTASWNSSSTASCSESGGIPGDAWGSDLDSPPPHPPAGTVNEVAQSGLFIYVLTCQNIDPTLGSTSLQAQLSVPAVTETLASSASSISIGQTFTLTWSSTAAVCTAAGGGASGAPWSGALAPSGSVTQTASQIGTFQYTLSCGAGNDQALQQVTVAVAAASTGGGGGGGGGGGIGILELTLLGLMCLGHARHTIQSSRVALRRAPAPAPARA